MKKYLLFTSIISIGILLGMGFSQKHKLSQYDVLFQTKVEALSEDETSIGMKHCRCHDDHKCYTGYTVSTRPVCAKGHYIQDCGDFNANCP